MPKKYQNDRLEDWLDAGYEGLKGGVEDIKEIVLHPIDTVTDTVGTVADLTADTVVYLAGPEIFNKDLYESAREDLIARNDNFKKLMNDLKEAQGPDYLEVATRGFVGGLGVRAAQKAVLKFGKMPIPKSDKPGYYDEVREHSIKYGKDHRTNPLLETADQFDELPYRRLLDGANNIRSNTRDAALTLGVVFGASDKQKKHENYFFNEAKAKESSFSENENMKPEDKPKQETKERKENPRKQFKATFNLNEEELKPEDKESFEKIFDKYDEILKQQDLAIKVQGSKEFFMDLNSFAQSINQPGIARFSRIAYEGVKITENVDKLKDAFPALQAVLGTDSMIGSLLSSVSSFGPQMAIISSIANIAMSFLGCAKEDPSMAMNKQYFEAILSSLNEVRKEIRHLGLEMNALFRSLMFQLEMVYQKLKYILVTQHEEVMSNLDQQNKDQREDTQYISKAMMKLTHTAKLNDLSSILCYLNTTDITDQELRKITTEVPSTWLGKDLIGSAYNGGIYSTDSSRQNSLFVGDEMDDPGSALGFITKYAKNENGLNLGDEFAKIDSEKLPLVPVWIPTLGDYLTAIELEAKRQHRVIALSHLRNQLAVIDNTLNLIKTSEDQVEKIFGSLFEQYLIALVKLYQSLEADLGYMLSINDKSYSLNEAMASGFISNQTMFGVLGTGLSSKILRHEQGLANKISALALMGKSLVNYTIEFQQDYHVNLPFGAGGDKCDKGKTTLWAYTAQLLGNFKLIYIDDGKTRVYASGEFEKEREKIHEGCHAKDWTVPSGVNEKTAQYIGRYYSEHVHVHLGKGSVRGFRFIEGESEYLNSRLSKRLANKMMTSLKSGQDFKTVFGEILGHDCEDIFKESTKKTKLDSATNAKYMDTIKVTRAMALVFAELLGLPDEVIVSLRATMISDIEILLADPSLLLKLKDQMLKLQSGILDSIPNRFSELEFQMLGAQDQIQKTLDRALTQQAYLDNLAEWRKDVNAYAQQLIQIEDMLQLDLFAEKDWSAQLLQSYLLLDHGQHLLNKAHQDLVKQGYDYFPAPKALDTLILEMRKRENTKSYTSSSTDNDLTFSIPKAAKRVQDAIAHVKKFPKQKYSACVQLGNSGDGKSSKINYLHGTDYVLKYDDEGQPYAEPTADEICPTGYGASITKFLTLIESEDCIEIDLPGPNDDEGPEADIARSVQVQMLPWVVDQLKVLELHVSAPALYSGRYAPIEKTFREAGNVIAKDPESNIKNILVAITKGSLHSAKVDAAMVYKKLKGWYEKSIKHLPPNDENYPIRHVLEHLQENQIMMLDVLDPSHRKEYLKRRREYKEAPIAQFDFRGVDKNAQALTNFTAKLNDKFNQNRDQIDRDMQNLKSHWVKRELLKDNYTRSSLPVSAQALQEFEVVQAEQHKIHAGIAEIINPDLMPDLRPDSKVPGDPDELVERIVEKTREQEESSPILEELWEDLEFLDHVHERPAYIEACAPGQWSIPPVACAYSLPGGSQEYSAPIFEMHTNPLDVFNAQLMFWRTVWNLGRKALGYTDKPPRSTAFVGHMYQPGRGEAPANVTATQPKLINKQ